MRMNKKFVKIINKITENLPVMFLFSISIYSLARGFGILGTAELIASIYFITNGKNK